MNERSRRNRPLPRHCQNRLTAAVCAVLPLRGTIVYLFKPTVPPSAKSRNLSMYFQLEIYAAMHAARLRITVSPSPPVAALLTPSKLPTA